MRRIVFGILTAAAVFSFFTACATGSNEELPEWVSSPPEDSSEYMYFTGAGSDPSGDSGAARAEAEQLIISDITRFLGVRVSSDTTVEAKDAYGEFQSSLTAVINEKSSARLSGMRVADIREVSGDSGVDVYILVEYSRAELLAEKARLEELFREKQEAISGPEKEGDSLISEGKYYRAAVKYIEAALAASGSDLENADIKFERNITKARTAVEKLSIEAVSGPESGYSGEKFSEKFRVRMTAGENPAEGLPVTVSYKELRANGRKTVMTHTMLTDKDGYAEFESPAPEWVGSEKMTFFLDMRAAIEPLEDVSFGLLQYVDGLEQAVNSRKTVFEYNVLSRAVEVPTCVMVMDVDRSGNPIDRTDTASGILSELSDAGFNVFMLPVDYRMTAVSDSEMIDIISRQYGGIYKRLVFGTAEISSFEESGNSVIVKVTGRIKAVDLESGRILFSASEQKRARGNSNAGTISAAFSSLGKLYGEKLLTDLP